MCRCSLLVHGSTRQVTAVLFRVALLPSCSLGSLFSKDMKMVLFKRRSRDARPDNSSKIDTPTQRNALQLSLSSGGIPRGKRSVNCVISSCLALVGIQGVSTDRTPFVKAAPTTRALLSSITSSSDLQVAVSAWCSDSVSASSTYGDISQWDISTVVAVQLCYIYKENTLSSYTEHDRGVN